MPDRTVLVVDDRPNMLGLVKRVLEDEVRVLTAGCGQDALDVLSKQSISVVLCDLRMPDMEGIEVLRECKRTKPATEFIVMTAYASVSSAVEALRLGAYDYITKPFEPDFLREIVRRALDHEHVAGAPDAPAPRHELLPGVFGRSKAMHELVEAIHRHADGDGAILVVGETGTGKERVARAIHALSPRSQRRFLSLSCAAATAEALDRELFGQPWPKAGALADRGGLLELAGGGTLFLDQLGELATSVQGKLVRELDADSCDVRLIGSSDADLGAMVRAGAFAEDLHRRFSVTVLEIAPLRARREDVSVLATHFLSQRCSTLSERRVEGFTPEALARLTACDWPGNVRQLRSVIERACRVAAGTLIEVRDLPLELDGPAHADGGDLSNLTWHEAVEHCREEAGRRYLSALMERYPGRVADAAAHAGIERESLYRLLRRYGVRAD